MSGSSMAAKKLSPTKNCVESLNNDAQSLRKELVFASIPSPLGNSISIIIIIIIIIIFIIIISKQSLYLFR